MKKIITGFVFVFLCAGIAQAQFNTDSKMVGASSSMDFGFFAETDKNTDEKTKTIAFDLNPRFGYFVDNMFAAGMDVNIATTRYKFEELDPTSSNYYSAGFFTRYYYQTAAPVVPFGELNAGLGRSVSKSTDFTGETQKSFHNVIYAGIGGGAAFFLADNFALEGMLLYEFNRQRNPEADGKHVIHGIMMQFGFTFFFNSLIQQ